MTRAEAEAQVEDVEVSGSCSANACSAALVVWVSMPRHVVCSACRRSRRTTPTSAKTMTTCQISMTKEVSQLIRSPCGAAPLLDRQANPGHQACCYAVLFPFVA